MTAANFSKTLNDWLDANDARLRGDAKVITGKAWRDRGEQYGETAVLVMLIEGSPLYAALNYGEPTWDLHTELNALCKANGFWFDFMYGWALSFHKINA